MNDLVWMTAREAVRRLAVREVSPLEMIDAAVERIEEADGAVNALPTLAVERAREHATRLMASGPPADVPPGYLHGLPFAVKDLKDVAGVRSTKGSPIYAEHVPECSDYLVENIEAQGVVVLAKSNTPEFGAGANTFNEVFGKTRSPWDTRMTCGGSSGAARRSHSRRGRCGSRRGATSAGACASRRASARWSGCVPRRGACRTGRRSCRSPGCRSRGRWAGRWATLRCSSMRRRAASRRWTPSACRARSVRSSRQWTRPARRSASRTRRTSASRRWTRRCARYAGAPCGFSRGWERRSRRMRRTYTTRRRYSRRCGRRSSRRCTGSICRRTASC